MMGITGEQRHRHQGEILDSLPDNRSRANYCLRKAETFRNRFYVGQRKSVYKAMASNDHTLSGESSVVRQVIGYRRWSNELDCKELVSQEQMWARWAVMYATFAQMDRVL